MFLSLIFVVLMSSVQSPTPSTHNADAVKQLEERFTAALLKRDDVDTESLPAGTSVTWTNIPSDFTSGFGGCTILT